MEKIKKLVKQILVVYFILAILDMVTMSSTGILRLFNCCYMWAFPVFAMIYKTKKNEELENINK